MRIEFCAPGAMDAQDVQMEAEGRISLMPLFYGSGDAATAGVLRSFDKDGKLIFTGVLRVDGATGRLTLADRSETVAPKMEREAVPKG